MSPSPTEDESWTIEIPPSLRAEKRIKHGHTKLQWMVLCSDYKHRCAYCGQKKPLTRDHIRPISKGGTDEIDNIVPACRECNKAKGNNFSSRQHRRKRRDRGTKWTNNRKPT